MGDEKYCFSGLARLLWELLVWKVSSDIFSGKNTYHRAYKEQHIIGIEEIISKLRSRHFWHNQRMHLIKTRLVFAA